MMMVRSEPHSALCLIHLREIIESGVNLAEERLSIAKATLTEELLRGEVRGDHFDGSEIFGFVSEC